MRYAYYPGCASEHLACAYEESLRQVMDFLKIELTNVPDWNCCGATECMSVNRLAAYSLVARNLALVPEGFKEVVSSCSACYLNLRKTDKTMLENPDINNAVNSALSAGKISYTPGRLTIKHILDLFVNDVGLSAIKERVVSPLTHLRVAPYYGCMLVRPGKSFDHPEYPETMDKLLSSLGAEVADFSLKAYCCGGHMPQIKPITGYEIIHRILKDAYDKNANLIAVTCPVCQANLDIYQEDVNKHFGTNFNIPVLFFTQLMGLAFGINHTSLGIGKEIVSAKQVLSEKSNLPMKDKKDIYQSNARLPMPEMKGGSKI